MSKHAYKPSEGGPIPVGFNKDRGPAQKDRLGDDTKSRSNPAKARKSLERHDGKL